ncbi:carboxylating nicotinate-nucleotide diphosphorylase [Kaarinaea lacus]
MQIPDDVAQVVSRALEEDIGSGDLSAHLIDANAHCHAHVISREAAVISGLPWFNEVFRQLHDSVNIQWLVADGARVPAQQRLCELDGPARALLSGERTALNFLQTLSATATLAARYADAVAGTGARVLDTRKTLPGLRTAQKYAVLCGGCFNHRMGLYDAILIKENHIMAAGSISAAVQQAQQRFPDKFIEVEVENFEQIKEALTCPVQRLLLDNMSITQLRDAVQMINSKMQTEASGGISLENIRKIAETGVDFISVGDLTKNVQAIDLSMRFDL